MPYLKVDADKAAHTDGIMAALGMTSGRIPTPTAIVGTQVIPGAGIDGILAAIKTQKDWGSAK